MYTHTTYMHIVHATGWDHRTDVWSDEDTVKGVTYIQQERSGNNAGRMQTTALCVVMNAVKLDVTS